MQPNIEKYEYLVGRQLKPEARTDIVFDLAEAGVTPNVHDRHFGWIASELLHIAKNSGVGLRIYEDKVPIDHVLLKLLSSSNWIRLRVP